MICIAIGCWVDFWLVSLFVSFAWNSGSLAFFSTASDQRESPYLNIGLGKEIVFASHHWIFCLCWCAIHQNIQKELAILCRRSCQSYGITKFSSLNSWFIVLRCFIFFIHHEFLLKRHMPLKLCIYPHVVRKSISRKRIPLLGHPLRDNDACFWVFPFDFTLTLFHIFYTLNLSPLHLQLRLLFAVVRGFTM